MRTRTRGLAAALTALILLASGFGRIAAAQAPCIIDNKDQTATRYFRATRGTWTRSTAGSSFWNPSAAKPNYVYAKTTSGDATRRAEWVATNLPAGNYEVFIWHPIRKNAAKSAKLPHGAI